MQETVTKLSRSFTVPIRGLGYHVRTWGEGDAPTLFMLHGWMDVGASFQFLVDALQREWHVIAPDWRGFGLSEWPVDGYWFADYLADLDALLDHFATRQSSSPGTGRERNPTAARAFPPILATSCRFRPSTAWRK